MNAKKIKVYDIEFGEVVYGRISGKVMAMKLIQIKSYYQNGASCHTDEMTFKCADGNELKVNMFNPIQLFCTIDDCINNVNQIAIYNCDYRSTFEEFGFVNEWVVTSWCRYNSFGKNMYYWDGYQAQKVHIPHSRFDYTIREDSIEITTNSVYDTYFSCKGKMYNSYEECKQANAVQVMTF